MEQNRRGLRCLVHELWEVMQQPIRTFLVCHKYEASRCEAEPRSVIAFNKANVNRPCSGLDEGDEIILNDEETKSMCRPAVAVSAMVQVPTPYGDLSTINDENGA